MGQDQIDINVNDMDDDNGGDGYGGDDTCSAGASSAGTEVADWTISAPLDS